MDALATEAPYGIVRRMNNPAAIFCALLMSGWASAAIAISESDTQVEQPTKGNDTEILVSELVEAEPIQKEVRFDCVRSKCSSVKLNFNTKGTLVSLKINNSAVDIKKIAPLIDVDSSIVAMKNRSGKILGMRVYFGSTKNCHALSPVRNFISILTSDPKEPEPLAWIDCKLTAI